MNEIGYRVKAIRKNQGLSQVQFAESIGISQGNLSEIEKGNSNPSADTTISIGIKFKVDLNWLLLGCTSNDTYINQNEDENKLLKEYRNLSIHDQKEMMEIILVKKKLRYIN